MEIKVSNVNELFSEMFWRLKAESVEADSRNGRVVKFPEPVLTTISNPTERVLFDADRDANPIFHLMESIWMLAGRSDVEFLRLFNTKIGQYSDDGVVFNASYGFRMRHTFCIDQLKECVRLLQRDRETRQAVIQLWDPSDLTRQTKDKACNTQLMLAVENDRLNLTVINRSNDMWWGYAGANPVHFSVIQEYIAGAIGVSVGKYITFSNNLHLYLDLYDTLNYRDVPPVWPKYDAYQSGSVFPLPLLEGTTSDHWLMDAVEFCNDPFNDCIYYSPFFSNVAFPMAMVSWTRKNHKGDGFYWADKIAASDWKLATQQWISTREAKRKAV
jgi:thymidylate synthase